MQCIVFMVNTGKKNIIMCDVYKSFFFYKLLGCHIFPRRQTLTMKNADISIVFLKKIKGELKINKIYFGALHLLGDCLKQ